MSENAEKKAAGFSPIATSTVLGQSVMSFPETRGFEEYFSR